MNENNILSKLAETLAICKQADLHRVHTPHDSITRELRQFSKKIGEEATELVIAG